MNKFLSVLFLLVIVFTSCSEDNDIELQKVTVTLKFTHNWDGAPVTSSDFNDFKFTTENGQSVSIEKLRYLVSNIKLETTLKEYQLINVGENTGLEISFDNITQGSKALNFTFGFEDSENIDGVYQDLNSVSFNVPAMLGGGYHYMQFDGKFKDTNNADANFNYHTIRAVDATDPNNLVLEDTSFEVDLGAIEIKNNVTIEVKMNIAEWFKNPNTWDLNTLNTVLMPNFEAQKMMSANGKNVFSLGEVTTN